MFRIIRFAQCLVAWLCLAGSLFGASTLQPLGFTNGQFRLRVNVEPGSDYLVESSTNLLEWITELEQPASAGPFEVVDGTSADLPRKFYRAKQVVLSGLKPTEVEVSSGDRLMFLLDVAGEGTAWNYTVNGVAGGNSSVGFIQSTTNNPAQALFSAPFITAPITVQVCAVDPNDTNRTYCATVRVLPPSTVLEVRPGATELALGNHLDFKGGGVVAGVQFIELRQVYWKVNGELGGNTNLGTIDSNGRYRAPKQMPVNMPLQILVGFSLTPEGAVQASSEVTLVELVIDPPIVRSFGINASATLTVLMRRSSATNLSPLPSADVVMISDRPPSATVSVCCLNSGETFGMVTFRATEGRALIKAEHKRNGAVGSAIAEARATPVMRLLEFEKFTDDKISITRTGTFGHISMLEVTRPRVKLQLMPDIYFARGFAPSTNSFWGLNGGTNLSIRGDGSNVIAYSRGGPIAQPSGVVAVIERNTGLIEFGDRPGTGIVTYVYNDGFIARTTGVRLVVSTVGISATLRAYSFSTNRSESYITEPIQGFIMLTNSHRANGFVGRTPVRIRLNGEKFSAAVRKIVETKGDFNDYPYNMHETEELTLIEEGTQGENFEAQLMGSSFFIFPKRSGEHRFMIDVPNDPRVTPVEIVMQVKRPTLRISAATNANISANSYVNIVHENGLPVSSAFYLPGIPVLDPMVWRIRSPGGQTKIVAYSPDRFPAVLHEPGIHIITLGLEKRTEVQTEELAVEIKPHSSSGFPAVAEAELKPISDTRGDPIERRNQFAGLAILEPTGGSWLPGVPFPIRLQVYDGEGNARQVGKKTITIRRSTSDPETVQITTNYVIASIRSLTNVISGKLPANGAGIIQFNYVKNIEFAGEQDRDLLLNFTTVMFSYTGDEIPDQPNLPVELFEYEDGVLVTEQRVAVGMADFVNSKDATLRSPTLMFPGRGIVANPLLLTIPAQRVRQAVEDGKLPQGSDQVTIELLGTAGFLNSLASGVNSVALGEGLSLVSQIITNGRLKLRMNTDLAYFEGDQTRYSSREILIHFGNGTTGKTSIYLTGYRLSTNSFQTDLNLPLNAAYGFRQGFNVGRFPIGSVSMEVLPVRNDLPLLGFDMELRPSIHACWDSNQNGEFDSNEDRHADGILDERDNFAGVPYRGVLPINPIIGFDRERDPDNGLVFVRGLKRELISNGDDCRIQIYGDTTDLRRLNRETLVLGDVGNKDDLPDFASREVNGEMLLCWLGGNLVDVVSFTAYSFVAESKSDLPDPGINFANLQGSMEDAYGKYSEVSPGATLASAGADSKLTGSVAVYVDHEADHTFFRPEGDFLMGFVPWQYYAGILDQYYQRTTRGGGYGYYTTPIPMGRDRVRGYDRERERLVTGVNRAFYGIDLDGVFYDPGWLDFPKPRQWDPDIVKTLAQTKVLDENPNSDALLDIPVVSEVLDSPALTPAGLVMRAGGTSGGYVDLDREHVGSLKAEAKTPGAELPGLHSGYLTLNKPEDIRDPRNSLIEDDIRDILIKRKRTSAQEPVGQKIEQEPLFLGTPAPRFVNGFAQNEDQKGPISTAARVNYSFLVKTDPPGVVPADATKWKFTSAISVREKPVEDDNEMDLIVTTQSDGDEKLVKLAFDTAIDLIAKVATGGALSAINKAGRGAFCAPEYGEKIAYVAIDCVLNGISGTELFEEQFDPGGLETSRKALNYAFKAAHQGGDSPLIPGISIPGVLKIQDALNPKRPRNLRIDNFRKEFIKPCDLVNLPFDFLANKIKATYSAETFGGLGSAEAIGTRMVTIAIPHSAQLTNGLYTVTFSLTRKIDIQPKENEAIQLFDLPYDQVFDEYPYADEISDDEFLGTLLELKNDPNAGDAATRILRAVGRRSVIRLPRDNLYSHYKIRAWKMPGVGGMVAPGMIINSSLAFGNFALTPGETEIPVSTAVVVTAGKSNENAGARARLTSPGYEMVFLGGVLMLNLPD